MKKEIGLTEGQIKLLLQCLEITIEMQKIFNPKKYSTENELRKISEYTELYKIIAEQYYEEKKIFKKIS